MAAGARLIVLCTNTMHKVAEAITDAVDVPFVHIADTTAERGSRRGLVTVGLLATRYTMEQDFYGGGCASGTGSKVMVPGEGGSRGSCTVIYDELCVGVVDDGVARRVPADHGAAWPSAAPEGILLGCTEIDLLVGPGDAPFPCSTPRACTPTRAVELALGVTADDPAGAGRVGDAISR